jgi:hypothetical protein
MDIHLMKYVEEQASLQRVILVLFMSYVNNKTCNCIFLDSFIATNFVCNKRIPKPVKYETFKYIQKIRVFQTGNTVFQ